MSEPARSSIGFVVVHVNLTEEEATVAIPPELEAQILRYSHVEKWRMGIVNGRGVYGLNVGGIQIDEAVSNAMLDALTAAAFEATLRASRLN